MALKLGAENRKQVAIAAALGLVVLVLVVRMLLSTFSSAPVVSGPPTPAGGPGPVAGPSGTAAPPVRTASASRPAAKVPHIGANLDPSLHPEVMQQAESLVYTGRGRNIFSANSAPLVSIPQPNRPIRPLPVAVNTGPPVPPPPPPIDLRFFGYQAQKSGVRKAFLIHGEDVFIAAEGEVVDHRYKVVKISPFSVELEDLPYNDTQTISLTAN